MSTLRPTRSSGRAMAPVKGLVGLARDVVCSRDARGSFDPPTPKPDTVAPSAEPRLGDGGDDEPAGSIGRLPRVGKNVRPRASGIAVAVPSVVRQQPPTPRKRSPRRRTRRARVRLRGARVSAQPTAPIFFAAIVPAAKSTSRRPDAAPASGFAAPPAVRRCAGSSSGNDAGGSAAVRRGERRRAPPSCGP